MFVQCPDGSIFSDVNIGFIRNKIRQDAKNNLEYKLLMENCQIHVKLIFIFEDYLADMFNNTLKFYEDIKYLNITPKLIEIRQILKYKIGIIQNDNEKEYYDEYDERIGAVYVSITEKYGISLTEKYRESTNINWGEGPGLDMLQVLDSSDTFHELFPHNIIPKFVTDQIILLLKTIEKIGWIYNDVHAGNFVIKDDIVKIIDFACVSKNIIRI